MLRKLLLAALVLLPLASPSFAGERKPGEKRRGPLPTVENFKYGTDSPRQVLDYWQADTDKPAPLVLMIHGGGWVIGDKSAYEADVQKYLDQGINVAAINYRLLHQAAKDGVEPAVKAPLHDAARALQTLRSKAKDWNIDPTRIGATGGSAGACSSLWLALHEDMADPRSSDPIARESTRLTCAAVSGAQTSLDPKQVREWMSNANYGGHAFGYFGKEFWSDETFQKALDNREKLLPWIKEYSPYELASRNDPPVFMDFNEAPPAPGALAKDPTHSAVYGVKLAERLDELKVEAVVSYPGHKDEKYGSIEKFLVAKLLPPGAARERRRRAQREAAAKAPTPTVANYKYGNDSERQVLDFWKANTEKPAPLVVFIHGGGWMFGDKLGHHKDVQAYLDAGFAVAAVNYRYIQQAMEQKVEPPVKACLHDAARAIQTLRSKAKEWNIDPARVGVTGGSAGGCTSLWLALHDDLADPNSSDPIARESTRVTCAVPDECQSSLDPKQVREWMPNANYGGHAFGYWKPDYPGEKSFQQSLDDRESILPWIKEFSPYESASKNDPPIFFTNRLPPPPSGEVAKDPTHSAIYAIKMAERLNELGVEAFASYPGHKNEKYGSAREFFIAKLNPSSSVETKPAGQKAGAKVPAPTVANYKYGGDSERQVFDFWKANTDKPAPLVLLIHGGGWMGGDKKSYAKDVPTYLNAGCAVAALNYRYIQQAMEQNVVPPVKAPLHDAARALQTLRSKAKEWNIDPTRVGSTGGSAGACTSLWLAFHDDLADPDSSDPIARESTRLTCAAVNGAQTSLDPKQLREWMANAIYAGHAFGFKAEGRSRPDEFQMALDNREKIMPWIKEYSPIELIDKNDPPVFLQYKAPPPPPGEVRPDPTHSVVYGIKLKEELDKLGVESVVSYDGNQDTKYGSVAKFLIAKLKAE